MFAPDCCPGSWVCDYASVSPGEGWYSKETHTHAKLQGRMFNRWRGVCHEAAPVNTINKALLPVEPVLSCFVLFL